MTRILLLLRLAIADLRLDKKLSFFTIAALIAVIAPLLLLFSLKYGVVSQLRQQLINDPQNLEIVMIGNGNYNKNWFKWLSEQPETGFSIAQTRSLSAVADLRKNSRNFVANAEVIPTGLGDPLLSYDKKQFQLNQLNDSVLSDLSAEKLQAKIGDEIQLIATRNYDGSIDKGIIKLKVVGIIPKVNFNRSAIFVNLALLEAIEDFRDGYTTDLFKDKKGKQRLSRRDSYAKARIYAKSIDDVAPLSLKLRSKYNLDTRTQEKAIANIKAIDSVLSIIFLVIAITAIIGCTLSLIGTFLANIDRKRKEIALLRLIGFKAIDVVGYLIFQAIILTFIAYWLSYLLFLFGSYAINYLLVSRLAGTSFISILEPFHLMQGFLFSLVLTFIVAGFGAKRASKIQPAESLRDV